jgi:hypothetical protein
MHKDVEEKSLADLAPSYEVTSAYLIHMLEAKFASLNPFMQYMFLKLYDIEDPEKKAFILETLRIEFRVVGTPNEDFRVLSNKMKILECQYLVNW